MARKMYLYSFLTVASIVRFSTSKYMQFNCTLYVYYLLEDQQKNRHKVSEDLTDKRVVKIDPDFEPLKAV